MSKWFSAAILSPLFLSTALFAQEGADAPAAPSGGGNMLQTLMMIGVALVFFYFILWRPEQKRRKTMETLRSSMKKGDRVTAMGIVGTIAKVSPETDTVILRMVDGNQIEVLKASISEVKPSAEEAKETEVISKNA